MATSTASNFAISSAAPVVSAARAASSRRRHITPRAGRALEVLGHAIEYLTDEFIHEGGSFSANNEQIEAVQMLMALNRQIYYECPVSPTLGERCRSLLGLRSIQAQAQQR